MSTLRSSPVHCLHLYRGVNRGSPFRALTTLGIDEVEVEGRDEVARLMRVGEKLSQSRGVTRDVH